MVIRISNRSKVSNSRFRTGSNKGFYNIIVKGTFCEKIRFKNFILNVK